MTDLKTPEQWCAELGVEILDPDGWRGRNGRPWTDPISQAEFQERLITCTQRIRVAADDRAEFAANRDAGLVKRHEQRLARAQETPWTEEERGFVETALQAVDAGNAGHWPTVAGYLADEVRRLRATSPLSRPVVDREEADTKALVETATRLGRELGRREAAEEIAHRCELDATYDTASRYHFAKIAREIATKEPK